VSGSSGYVGSVLARELAAGGWRVRELTRSGAPSLAGAEAARFALGDDAAVALEGAEALVHCAWDFGLRTWAEIEETNVRGSERLLRAAAGAGVERVVVVSTLSASRGVRSHYGRAKLAVEAATHAVGGAVVRPGLVWGEPPRSLYGTLSRLALRLPLLPAPDARDGRLRTTHEADLAGLVRRLLDEGPPSAARPIVAAAPEPWRLADLLVATAAAAGRRVRVVPVPWRVPWALLRLLEVAGLRPPFRSDSLVSLVGLRGDPYADGALPPPTPFRSFAPGAAAQASATSDAIR